MDNLLISESRAISAIVKNADLAPALAEANVDDLFEKHLDVWAYVKDYYYKYRSVIPRDILKEKFPDFNFVDTSGNVKHYLDQLRADFLKSMLKRIAVGVSRDLDNFPIELLVSETSSKLSDLASISTNIKDLDITDAEKANQHYEEKRRLMEENGGVLGIRTGFDAIDANYPTGMAPGQYIAIISRTGQGKSWFALQLAINAWRQGKKVLYVSLEMPPESVRDRAYTYISNGVFGMSALSRATIDMEAITLWTKESFNSDGSFVVTASDGMGDFSPSHLQAKIDQYAPDIVYVDYMQLMADRRNSSGATERVRNVSKEVKSIAMTNEIPIVMVTAASVNETKEYNSPPQIYENAESKQAVFDVDLCLALISHKQNDGTLLMEMCCRKNRHGPDFNFLIELDIAKGHMKEQFDASLLE
jgi:replicative DNA helicase